MRAMRMSLPPRASPPFRRAMQVTILARMPRRHLARTALSLAAILMIASTSGCRSPQADAYMAEQLRQMADELNAARQQQAQIQSELDSLHTIVARQDTLLTRLAGMAGVPR